MNLKVLPPLHHVDDTSKVLPPPSKASSSTAKSPKLALSEEFCKFTSNRVHLFLAQCEVTTKRSNVDVSELVPRIWRCIKMSKSCRCGRHSIGEYFKRVAYAIWQLVKTFFWQSDRQVAKRAFVRTMGESLVNEVIKNFPGEYKSKDKALYLRAAEKMYDVLMSDAIAFYGVRSIKECATLNVHPLVLPKELLTELSEVANLPENDQLSRLRQMNEAAQREIHALKSQNVEMRERNLVLIPFMLEMLKK